MPQLIVIIPPDLAPGFALTGARTYVAADLAEAERLLRLRMDEDVDGVIALHAPYFHHLSPKLHEQVQTDYHPLVIPLPDGLPGRGEVSRRQQLTEMLRRVIGYSISFRGEGEPESK